MRKKKRFRWLRRLVILAVVLAVAAFVLRAYFLSVYAPGLRSEARTIPARVHADLASHSEDYVPLSQISPYLQSGIVAIEDHRFYEHPGVDPLSLIRAAWVNLTDKHVDQGGSTLEQQLVKRAIVHQHSTIRQKLRTVALAWAVDQVFSKPRILELYLNAAYYGQGAYGAGSAARVYFNKPVGQLSLPEAAFLAAVPQAPSIYGAHPLSSPIVDRQHTVLRRMQKYGYITPAQEQVAETTRLNFAFQVQPG